MKYERILDEHGNFKGIKILSTGKIIRCRTYTDLDDNLSIWIDDDRLDLLDTTNNVEFIIKYEEYNYIGGLASVMAVANNKANECWICAITQGVDKVKVSGNAINEGEDVLENENIEEYTKTLLSTFSRANYINANPSFQTMKGIIIQFANEQVTKTVNYKFNNARKVTKMIEDEKRVLESEIEKISAKISSYDNLIAQIQPSGKKI